MKRTFTAALSWVLTFTLMLSVGGAAFADTLTLPSSLSVLGEEAFCGDTSLDEVVVPGGVTEIGSRAFADSTLRRVYLPATVGNIAGDAFAGTNAEIIRTISPGESSAAPSSGSGAWTPSPARRKRVSADAAHKAAPGPSSRGRALLLRCEFLLRR